MNINQYRYIIKDDNEEVLALMDDIENVLIFLEALNERYYNEETLNYTIERTIIEGEN